MEVLYEHVQNHWRDWNNKITLQNNKVHHHLVVEQFKTLTVFFDDGFTILYHQAIIQLVL